MRTEFLNEDLLSFLNREFSEHNKWDQIIKNFKGEKFKKTVKKEYMIDPYLKCDLQNFLSEEYELYNYLLKRKIN